MFGRIADRIRSDGFNAEVTAISAGNYYDGIQRGELIPAVMVSVDTRDVNHNRAPIEKSIKKAIRNMPGVTFKRSDFNFYYYTYYITRAEDFERVDKLNKKASTFIEGFWQAIHDLGDAARANNAALAIEAGHAAIINAGMEV